VREVGETESEAGETGAVTVNVTAMDKGLLDAPVAVMVTIPLYVPAVRDAGATDTKMDEVASDTLSQV
jgi:hypothetical protein